VIEKEGYRSNQERYYVPLGMLCRINKIRKIAGGLCCKCGKFNTYLLKYKMDGIIVVEKFCEEHVPDKDISITNTC
jgi:hypothetical protein